MASARAFTTLKPSSNDIAPAKTSAVYSPKLKPAHLAQFAIAAGSSTRSFSTAASPDRNSAGCAKTVSSSFSFGPLTHKSSKSYPRISAALSHISLTAGKDETLFSIPTACEPWPGKRNAILEDETFGVSVTETSVPPVAD
jgi:hypothetical protein